jgi:RNA polymerase sigma factor (TIGR02999 family)
MTSNPAPDAGRDLRQRFPELYQELVKLAASKLSKFPPQSVTASQLTHEVFIKLTDEEVRRRASGRSELGNQPDAVFKACFGMACRDVLVDHARRRRAERRGGNLHREPLSTSIPFESGNPHDVLDIHDALVALAALDPRPAEVAELRVFGGLTIAECAEALELPTRAVDRLWAFARAWLKDRLG